MIPGVGASLYRQADALLSRSADAFSRAAAEDPRTMCPADLPGAAVDTVDAKALAGFGGALIRTERTLDRALLDLIA